MTLPLMHRVVAAVKRDGQHTAETLRPLFPESRYPQLQRALWNAQTKGLVQVVDTFSECGRRHAWYGPTEKVPAKAKENLLRKVATAVIGANGVTTDDLIEQFPGVSRERIVKSLENAKGVGLIESAPGKPGRSRLGVPCAVFYARGCVAGAQLDDLDEDELFRPNVKQPRKPAFASVFHYAQGITATTEAA
jgi:hypothetical protein